MKTKFFHNSNLTRSAVLAATAAAFLDTVQVATFASASIPDPYTNSWLTAYSRKYARIYTNNSMKASGTVLTTWSNGSQTQGSPAYAGVQEVYSSSNWVYIRSSGLASHVMGPWQNGAFPNLPVNQKSFWRFPRTNSVPPTKTLPRLASIHFSLYRLSTLPTRNTFHC